MPGRIAESQVSTAASHLAKAIGLVTQKAGLVGKPVQHLTEKLGDP